MKLLTKIYLITIAALYMLLNLLNDADVGRSGKGRGECDLIAAFFFPEAPAQP